MAHSEMAETTSLNKSAGRSNGSGDGLKQPHHRMWPIAPKSIRSLMALGLDRLNGLSVDLRLLTFTMMMAVAVVPIMLFYNWIEQSSFEKEIAQVDENHLVIAKNLSSTLSRYIIDTKAIFTLTVANHADVQTTSGFAEALGNFDLCQVLILGPDNHIVSRIEAAGHHSLDLPSAANLSHLRQIAADAQGQIAISGIRNHAGQPHFFLTQQLPNGQIAVAPWATDFISETQRSIAFGSNGHSMIVDQFGRVVAHPNADWQATSKDASSLPVVAAMNNGQTGVMQFFSPPMQAQMIAGFTHIPETGWGVMVPQPLSELEDRAQVVQQAAIMIAVFEISLVAFVSYWFSNLLIGPIQAVGRAAHRVSGGDHQARIWSLPKSTPGEIIDLAKSFNIMVDDIQAKTDRLKQALDDAEHTAHERNELLAAAQHATEVKTQFVSMVSHELRTPLTSIKGSLALMNSGKLGALTPQTQELIAIAAKNSEHLSTLIDDLLDLDKLSSGKIHYDFRSMDVVTLLKDALGANLGYGHLRNITFNLNSPLSSARIRGDHNRLLQVMANLLSNAAKFSDPGSQVDIRLEHRDNRLHISVQDYGIGIPEDVKDRIFDKFVQLDTCNMRQVGGTGLGLSIARLIVDDHGGCLNYHSIEGQGTTFYFDLPML